MSPPPPITPIAKGVVCFCLEEFSKGEGARGRVQALRDAVAALAPGYGGLAEVLDQYLVRHVFTKVATRQKMLEHLKKYWFDDTEDAFFKLPAPVSVSKVYGEGLLKTLDLALSNKAGTVPIASWWILDQPTLVMANLADLEEGAVVGTVTLLILTPRPDPEREEEADEPTPPAILGNEAEAFVTWMRERRHHPPVVKTDRVRDFGSGEIEG